jgi:hypothetical protein
VELELDMHKLIGVFVAAAALTTVVLGGTAGMANAASAAAPAACTGTVQVTSFVFSPASVSVGKGSTATMTLQNCTATSQSVQGIWYGRYTAPGVSGIPSGCPAIDPLVLNTTLAPNGTGTQSLGYTTIAGCQATGLDAIANLSIGATSLGTFTAHLTITGVTATCSVHYAKSEWTGGFTANITIANTGTATITSWTLAFTFPGDQMITNPWNGIVHQSGQNVTITNEPYNGTITPGTSITLGFNGTWKTNDASPTAFTLNGAACTTV